VWKHSLCIVQIWLLLFVHLLVRKNQLFNVCCSQLVRVFLYKPLHCNTGVLPHCQYTWVITSCKSTHLSQNLLAIVMRTLLVITGTFLPPPLPLYNTLMTSSLPPLLLIRWQMSPLQLSFPWRISMSLTVECTLTSDLFLIREMSH